MSDTLFDPSPYEVEPPATPEVLAAPHHPLLDTLGLSVDVPNSDYQFVEVTLKPEAEFFESTWRDDKDDTTMSYIGKYMAAEDNQMHWRKKDNSKNKFFEGFLQGAFRLQASGDIVLHIEADCTDLQASSVAIKLDDISQVSVYSEDESTVFAAVQNAAVNSNTRDFQLLKGYGVEVTLSYEELEPYVTTYKPRPTVVFTNEA